MSKRSESSQRAKQTKERRPPTSEELAFELAVLEKVRDDEIDMTDMPEDLDWDDAVIGKYYRPIKEPVSLRIDADILGWFKAFGKGYQSRINAVLRHHMIDYLTEAGKIQEGRRSNGNGNIRKRKSAKIVAKKSSRK